MRKYTFLLIVLLSTLGTQAYSQRQTDGAWFAITSDGNFLKQYKIDYVADAQLRLINRDDNYELSLLQSGLGYRPHSGLSFWLGYQWNAFNPVYHIERENRIWEQVLWEVFNNGFLTLKTRTRLEQRSRMHQPEWSNRVREKITLYFPQINHQYTPLIFNEAFFNINKPIWAGTNTWEQNRTFIGMDIAFSKKIFLEVGYLQQNFFNIQRRVNHVMYLGLNINTSEVALPDYTQ